ncbi:MAG: glycosyltransferase family 39 protein [Candidatus Omnitrophota bacterium]|nr:glycosyltransferase family 39 protein [Candidatus Omnitrophota bacterium]
MNNQRMCAIAIAVFFMSLYCLFSIGHYGGDGYEDYLTAKSIVLNHSLAFNDSPTDIDGFGYMKKSGIEGSGGNTYSSRGGLAVPVILSVFFYTGHITAHFFKNIPHDFITMFFVSFSNPLVSAINCLLIFIISTNLFFSRRISIILAFIYGLATMAPAYSRTGFEEPVMILFMLFAFYFILKYKNSAEIKYLLLAGTAIGLSVFTKSTAIIFLPAFTIYACCLIFSGARAKAEILKDASVLLTVLAVFLVLITAYNYVIYGKLLKFGSREALAVTGRVAEAPHVLKGLYYYLISTGKGFFIFNLPIILSFIGLAGISGKRKKEAVLFLLIFISSLIFFAMSFRRGSLFAWGPRYLLPSVAFLIFLIGDFLENNKNLTAKSAAWVLSIAGFFIMLPCMLINQSKFYFFVKEKLGIPEYMVNFIPDLSPILGGWKMVITRIIFITKGLDIPFVYNPDYRLISPVRGSMSGYNNFDFWFLKVLGIRSEYNMQVFGLLLLLVIAVAFSLTYIVRSTYSKAAVKD